ncbi:toxin-antitoxin system HicB family antitoxin [Nocardioides sp. R-C-SC26]|uniref:toxin-antitoxin system HicB family antitoxin n=1 Tax=Nocardioides sp. R-C-SC26 TaxID=2870414 RepID=UPI001E29273C|nr:toxin-antitoxin system HicB family antitoxin [Nocardioides sp. R-C-SC26]
MDIAPYVEHLRRDLLTAAQGAGADVVAAAERLGFAIEPAARLALMEAVSQACAEITAEMPAGGVDVRLDGRDLAFVVDASTTPPAPRGGHDAPPAPPVPPVPPVPPAPPGEPDIDDATARITLRLPESVKARAEDAAAAAGQSLNTWLTNAVRRATDPDTISVDLDLSSVPFLGGQRGPGARRMTGWI